MCDGEAAPGALWGGLFRPFEYIFHPQHSINCGFPDSTFLYTKVMYMYTCTVCPCACFHCVYSACHNFNIYTFPVLKTEHMVSLLKMSTMYPFTFIHLYFK